MHIQCLLLLCILLLSCNFLKYKGQAGCQPRGGYHTLGGNIFRFAPLLASTPEKGNPKFLNYYGMHTCVSFSRSKRAPEAKIDDLAGATPSCTAQPSSECSAVIPHRHEELGMGQIPPLSPALSISLTPSTSSQAKYVNSTSPVISETNNVTPNTTCSTAVTSIATLTSETYPDTHMNSSTLPCFPLGRFQDTPFVNIKTPSFSAPTSFTRYGFSPNINGGPNGTDFPSIPLHTLAPLAFLHFQVTSGMMHLILLVQDHWILILQYVNY